LIGGALVDVRATTQERWASGQSLPGRARLVAGGACRNVAVHLARLGWHATLLTVVGDDPFGRWLVEATAAAGVDVAQILHSPGQTGLYVSVGPEAGQAWSVSDASSIEGVGAEPLEAWRPIIERAEIVVCDANLSTAALAAAAGVAGRRPRVLLAVSPTKAPRLRHTLPGAAAVVSSRAEALALTGLPATLSWQALGTAILTEGVERAVVTLGESGVGMVMADGAVAAPAVSVEVTDTTGAGDAVAAIMIHAILAGLSPEAAVALAARAAAVVVQSPDTTPDISEMVGS
jgi:pseudouridine kinase